MAQAPGFRSLAVVPQGLKSNPITRKYTNFR